MSLAPGYTGKTCIGTLLSGTRAGAPRRTFLYNICDHQASYEEVESQAISYTAGAPAAVAALLYLQGAWSQPGLWNVEQLDPDPFLSLLPRLGLGWNTIEVPDDRAPVPRAVGR
jgi:carboxynorspermidine synthase